MENRRLNSDRVFRRHYRFIFYAGFTIGCMFLISWMHNRARIDASRSTNVQRCTNSHSLPPPSSYSPRFLVARSCSSLTCSHFYTNPQSFIRFSLSLSLSLFLFSYSFLFSVSLRVSSISSHLFGEISLFLACSLRDPLKSFSLCTFRAIHFPE